ncbi:MAG: DUF2807 domain-containing protein [Anaerolineae bacterium]|nr:DUF2807 domain-containing protein [Anaerolineae bacterium]
MSKLVLFLTAVAALALLSGCFPVVVGGEQVVGSGRTVTEEYDFTGFTRVAVGSAFEVDINQGDAYAVAVTVDDNLVQHLDVRMDGDTLRIGLKPALRFSFRNTTLRAEITMPDVEALDLSGATRTRLDGFSSDKTVDVEVSGASQLTGDMTSGAMNVEASGASRVELSGETGNLDARASGASTLRLQDLASGDTRVDASGASTIVVNPSGRLTGDASGASTVRYAGSPATVQVDTSGASSVRKD